MNKNYYCIVVGKKGYKKLLEELNNKDNFIMYPPPKNGKTYINSLYGLPVKISQLVDENCIKPMTKEEYDKLNRMELKELENFMAEYEPDYMWK